MPYRWRCWPPMPITAPPPGYGTQPETLDTRTRGQRDHRRLPSPAPTAHTPPLLIFLAEPISAQTHSLEEAQQPVWGWSGHRRHYRTPGTPGPYAALSYMHLWATPTRATQKKLWRDSRPTEVGSSHDATQTRESPRLFSAQSAFACRRSVPSPLRRASPGRAGARCPRHQVWWHVTHCVACGRAPRFAAPLPLDGRLCELQAAATVIQRPAAHLLAKRRRAHRRRRVPSTGGAHAPIGT